MVDAIVDRRPRVPGLLKYFQKYGTSGWWQKCTFLNYLCISEEFKECVGWVWGSEVRRQTKC